MQSSRHIFHSCLFSLIQTVFAFFLSAKLNRKKYQASLRQLLRDQHSLQPVFSTDHEQREIGKDGVLRRRDRTQHRFLGWWTVNYSFHRNCWISPENSQAVPATPEVILIPMSNSSTRAGQCYLSQADLLPC